MTEGYAARVGDDIIHTSLLADIAALAFEGIAYAAAGAIVAGAAMLAAPALATAGLAGAAAVAGAMSGCVGAGLVSGMLISLTGMGDVISQGCGQLANLLFPPSPAGKISTGSRNVQTNGLAAARAAGRLLTETEKAQLPPEPESGSLRDAMSMLLHSGAALLSQLWQPTVDGPSAPVAEAEVDKVGCTKHGPAPQYLAEGSSKVAINGLPAVRAGDRTTCEARVTTKVSENVVIGGKAVVVRPVSSGKMPGLELMYMAASLVTRRPGKLVKNLPCMLAMSGAGMAADRLMNAIHATFNPVHAATGAKVLAGEEELDFTLPARWPLVWQRVYNSRNRAEGLFGCGWRTEFETRVDRDGDEYCWHDMGGRELRLPRPAEGMQLSDAGEGIFWAAGEQGQLVIADADGSVWRLYLPHPTEPQRLRLASLSDEYGNGLLLHYDERDRLDGITDTEGVLQVSLRYGLAAFPRRVTGITERQENGDERPLMYYAYDQRGNLAEVSDAAGIVTRAFGWTAERLLAWHRLPGGLRNDYRWQKFDDWRVTEQRTSAGGHYTLDYDMARRLTGVTDESGHQHEHAWSAAFLPERYTDEAGNSWLYRWDENDLLQESTDPLGQRRYWRYDSAGNIVEEEDPQGRVRLTQWLAERSLPACVTEPDGSRRLYSYDDCHGLVCEVDELGRQQRYERDEYGQVVRHINAAGGVSHFAWNRHGQLTESRDCAGQATRCRYNQAHLLCGVTDAAGESLRYKYDAAGRPLEVAGAEGWRNRLQRDARGRPVTYYAADGTRTQYEWDDAGRLVLTRNPRGGEVRREYDTRGRLTALSNENQESYRFVWGVNDRLVAEHGLDGIITRYKYDACDREVSRIFAADTPQALEHKTLYDASGRVQNLITPDGETRYGWSPTGLLTSANFAPCDKAEQAQALEFQYDAAGQLLLEKNGDGAVRYQYDDTGNRTAVTLPDGRSLKNFYYGSGHLLHIMLDDLTITEFTRDALHREASRTQGALTTRLTYDRLGRLSRRSVHNAPYPARPLSEQSLHHDLRHNLVREQQECAPHGWRQYRYDEEDRLRQRASSFQSPELWFYDAAANPMDRDARESHCRHNRVTRFEDIHFRYDIYGRTTEKTRSGERWTYTYNAQHRLKEVVHYPAQSAEPPRHTRFTYDPLGRRTAKASWYGPRPVHGQPDASRPRPRSRTTFVWEGLRLLAEERDGRPMVYVYEDQESYAPLARIDGRDAETAVYYCHCQQNGLAERMTDAQGETYWQASFSSWGKTQLEGGPARHDGDEHNLRFQGQYLDRETGLHYNLFRYYDPDVGRFTQHDPIGLVGGLNLYQYVVNPLGWVDPLGLACKSTKRKNSSGKEVTRRYVKDQDALLNEAEKAAGGNLDSFNNYKPDWYKSPDGKRKIEWNPLGHSNTNEGPHVTVRDVDHSGKKERWPVSDKVFIEGRDKYDGGW